MAIFHFYLNSHRISANFRSVTWTKEVQPEGPFTNMDPCMDKWWHGQQSVWYIVEVREWISNFTHTF